MSNENNDQSLDRQAANAMARQLLRSFSMSGLQTLPKPQDQYDFGLSAPPPEIETARTAAEPQKKSAAIEKPAAASGKAAVAAPTQPTPGPVLDHYESEPVAESERASQLQLVQSEVSQCTKCSELAACRKNTVFGVGNPSPQVCFLGEGPGADEDRQGEPFVGAAGQLLNRIIEACKMKREDVYILNTVKCRPPGNRNPTEDELANCWPYAVRQLEILQPKFICCLGSVAAKTLLQTKQSIGRMRGQFFQYRGSQVIVTYHPAYLLRNPSAKRKVWDDMKILLAAMGKEL